MIFVISAYLLLKESLKGKKMPLNEINFILADMRQTVLRLICE